MKVFKYVLSSKWAPQGCKNVNFSTRRIPIQKPSKWRVPRRTHRQQKSDPNATSAVFVNSG